MALAKGLVVNSRRMAGMMLSGEMVTTSASGSISPITVLTASPPFLRSRSR